MTEVVALDLSLAATGWAVIGNSIVSGTIKTKPAHPLMDRLAEIIDGIAGDVAPFDLPGPQPFVVIEDFVTRSPAASLLGMVHGAVRLWLHQNDVKPLLVPPAALKTYATGKGNATKPDMRVELLKRTGDDLRDDNRVDAIWLAYLGRAALGDPLLDLPQSHTRALDKLDLSGLRAVQEDDAK